MEEIITQFTKLAIKGKKRPLVRLKDYIFDSQTTITAISCQEEAYERNLLPCNARGLFLTQNENDSKYQIAARGYDKFFNVGQLENTTWEWLVTNSKGPYEVTCKENGCIIFATGIKDDKLLVTSKNSLGSIRDDNNLKTHAGVGEDWLIKHLNSVKKTKIDFAKFAKINNVTFVFELADDDFEEHILEYPEEKRGLYLHGINENTVEFKTWEFSEVKRLADQFGFKCVDVKVFENANDVKTFTDACRITGCYLGRPIEGFVVRCHQTESNKTHFFKVKYDEPYLMFREWREVTKMLLRKNATFKWRPRYKLTESYIDWTRRKIASEPKLFLDYTKNKGIINIRNLFLQSIGLELGEGLVSKSHDTTEDFKSGKSDFKVDEDEVRTHNFSKLTTKDKNDTKTKADTLLKLNTPLKFEDLRSQTDSPLLILPVGINGCGKTTLGLHLQSLYPHLSVVQHDDIKLSKSSQPFKSAVFNTLLIKDTTIVYADRSNHLQKDRLDLVESFKKLYPNGKVVGVCWTICDSRDEAIQFSRDRIKERGENHQRIVYEMKNLDSLLNATVFPFEAVDLSTETYFDDVVVLEKTETVYHSLNKVLASLEFPLVSENQIESVKQTFDNLFNREIIKRNVNLKEKKKQQPQEQKPANPKGQKKSKPVRFIGVKLDQASIQVLKDKLDQIENDQFRLFYTKLKTNNRINKSLHLTLAINSEVYSQKDTNKTDQQTKLNDEIFKTYFDQQQEEPTFIETVTLKFEKVYWDNRILTTLCTEMITVGASLRCANAFPHITLGMIDESVKAKESNGVLEKAVAGGGGIESAGFGDGVWLSGTLEKFYF